MNLLRQHRRIATAVALALALSACGKSPEQHLQQAQARLQKAGYRAAVIELKTVLEKEPDSRAAHLLLAEVFLRDGAYPDAEQELERARSLGAPDEQALPPLAKAYLRMNEPQKALGLGVPASGLSPRPLAALHAVRAQAQLALGQRTEAEHSMEAGVHADLRQPELNNLASVLSERSDKRALGFAEQAVKLKPDNPAIMDTTGWILVQQGQIERGARLLQQAVSRMPGSPEVHWHLASAYAKNGDRALARRELERLQAGGTAFRHQPEARGLLQQLRGTSP